VTVCLQERRTCILKRKSVVGVEQVGLIYMLPRHWAENIDELGASVSRYAKWLLKGVKGRKCEECMYYTPCGCTGDSHGVCDIKGEIVSPDDDACEDFEPAEVEKK